MRNDYTKDWELYNRGKQWNRRLDPPYYDMVTTNWEMFKGNQWINAQGLKDFPKPVFNIIKRVIRFFVASMTSTAIKVAYSPLENRDDDYDENLDQKASEMLTAAFSNYADRTKINNTTKSMLFDAAITGDMCKHMWFDTNIKPYGGKFKGIKGQIECEMIDGNNVYFGNPNDCRVQKQPYILIYGRDTVKNLREEAKQHKMKDQVHDADSIEGDSDYEEQASLAGKIEMTETESEYGKAGYVIKYEKKKVKVKKTTMELDPMQGFEVETETTEEETHVFVSKCLEDRYIYKDVDTGLSLYPIAFNNWEKAKNSYHGYALCTEIIPNQIFINRMFAMAMYNLMMTAFGKVVYDSNMISGWSNTIGSAIPVDRRPGERITDVAAYLTPSVMSPQITELINLTLEYTKEMLGANDALLGDINPEQASGVSISVTAKQSGVPLENPKSNLYELIEDEAKIFGDMAATYYGERPVLVDVDGNKQIEYFDFGQLKDVFLNTKVDVGPTTYWSEPAMIATLDNMLGNGWIEFVEYLERLPEDHIPMKQELIDKFKNAGNELKFELMALFLESLTPEQQQQIMSLPEKEQEQAMMQILQEQEAMQNEMQPMQTTADGVQF